MAENMSSRPKRHPGNTPEAVMDPQPEEGLIKGGKRKIDDSQLNLSAEKALPPNKRPRRQSHSGSQGYTSATANDNGELLVGGANSVHVTVGTHRSMSSTPRNRQSTKNDRSDTPGSSGRNSLQAERRERGHSTRHLRDGESRGTHSHARPPQGPRQHSNSQFNKATSRNEQHSRPEQPVSTYQSSDHDEMSADPTLVANRLFSVWRVAETKSKTPGTSSPRTDLILATPAYRRASIQTIISQITSPEMFATPYICPEATDNGHIHMSLNGIMPSVLTGRLLYRPNKADMNSVREIGYPPEHSKTRARPGDFLIERSKDSMQALCDIHDHLRARKAELREQWLQKNPEFAHNLEPQWHETFNDGPKRIPFLSGKDQIVAGKACEVGDIHRIMEWNRTERKVVFVRGKPVEGQPGKAKKHEYIFINAFTGAEVLRHRTGHAIILPETEELYERLTYFITHTNFEKFLETDEDNNSPRVEDGRAHREEDRRARRKDDDRARREDVRATDRRRSNASGQQENRQPHRTPTFKDSPRYGYLTDHSHYSRRNTYASDYTRQTRRDSYASDYTVDTRGDSYILTPHIGRESHVADYARQTHRDSYVPEYVRETPKLKQVTPSGSTKATDTSADARECQATQYPRALHYD